MEADDIREEARFKTEVSLFLLEGRDLFRQLRTVLEQREGEKVEMRQFREDISEHTNRLRVVEDRVAKVFWGSAALAAALALGAKYLG